MSAALEMTVGLDRPFLGGRASARLTQTYERIEDALDRHRGRVAVLSSFGVDAAVLLALVADIDASAPVLFLDTGRHFVETLAYRAKLVALLGLTDVRDIVPENAKDADPTGELWHFDPDACCKLRKVKPLRAALFEFDAWISGRKRFQADTRAALPFVEREGTQVKFNPMADWTAEDIEAEFTRRGLPRHGLVARGYTSIGCAPCTRSTGPEEDVRAGRWAHAAKVECGIHRPVFTHSDAPANER